jgi:type I restriction enzyme S subunit
VTNNSLIVHPAPGNDLRLVYYALQSVQHELQGTSTAIPMLTQDMLRSVKVPVPPAATQRAIADFLEAETARIDALIAKKLQLARLLEERWRSAVRNRMQELGQRHGQIALKRLVRCLDGRRVPLSAEERAARRGPYPYFGASGQIDTVDDYLFDETLVLLGEDGAQLADPNYEISVVVSGPVWVNNHAHVLRPLFVDPWFLAMHLSMVDRALVISGATREKITQSDMDNIPVPDVPISDQVIHSETLRKMKAMTEKSSAALSSQVGLLREHRQALITAAVTGELEIRGVAA